MRHTIDQVRQIHLIPTFHYDVAYLKPYGAYLPAAFQIIDEALRILEQNDDYRYLIEQVILLDEYWQRFPEKRDLLRRFAREGRLEAAPGMWVMPDMNMPDVESMFLQCRIGRQWLAEHLGLEPKVCWIADCWGHHAQLPQILRSCGYSYYVFWRCMRRDVLRNDFVWRGLDGTSINAHWLARGYSNMRFPAAVEAVNALELRFSGCRPDDVRRLGEDLLQYGPSERLIVCNGGDMAMPQATAPQVVAALNRSEGTPPIAFATPTAALSQVNWDQAPTVDGEFNSALQGTFTSNIRIKQRDRALRNRMRAIEALAVALGCPLADRDALWKPILKQQFHDILCGTICDAALRDCYNEYDLAAAALEMARLSLCDGGPDAVEAVFNPLPCPRRELIRYNGAPAIIDLPALGFAPMTSAKPLEDQPVGALPARFENQWFSLEIGGDGYIQRLITRSNGRDLVGDKPPAKFGQLTLQMDYGDLWLNFHGPLAGGNFAASLTQNDPDPLERADVGHSLTQGTVYAQVQSARIVEQSAEHLVIEQQGLLSYWRLRIPFTTRMTVSRLTSRIAFQTVVQPVGRHYRIRAAFASSIVGGVRRDEIAAGLQVREAGEHVAQTFLDYSDDSGGLTLINHGTPASNVCEGVLMLTLFRSSAMEYKAESADSFNDGVQHSFDYAVAPRAAGDAALAEMIRTAHTFDQPALACRVPRSMEGDRGWRLEPASVQMSAVRHHQSGIFVRIYESIGKPVQARLAVPRQWTSCQAADGLEQPIGEPHPIQGGVLELSLRPYEIRGLLLAAG